MDQHAWPPELCLRTRIALRFARLLAALAIAAAPTCLIAKPAPSTSAPSRAAASTGPAGEVSRQSERLYSRWLFALADPALEGRGSGTEGLDKARDYIVRQYESFGLKGAFGGKYLQPLTITLGMKSQSQSLRYRTNASGNIVRCTAGTDFSALGISGDGKAAGALVFAGYGLVNTLRDYDSYKGIKDGALKGKVVVAFRYEPQDANGNSRWSAGSWSGFSSLPAKAQMARRHGAAALLIVNGPSHENDPLPYAQSAKGSATIPVFFISTACFRKMLAAAGMDPSKLAQWQAAADKGPVIEELKGLSVSLNVKMVPAQVTVSNVAAVLPGAGSLAKQTIIVGGHYDHIGIRGEGKARAVNPGADDNASGATGVLLLAKRFAELAAAGRDVDGRKLPADRRTIIFAHFTAEELGMLGSAFMADNLRDLGIERTQLVAMVNLDMIGRLRNRQLYIYGTQSGDRWDEIIKASKRHSTLRVWSGGDGIGPSDHISFNRINVPVLEFFTGLHADVHRSTDTPDKINVRGAVAVVDVAQRVVNHLWLDATPVAFTGGAKPRKALLGVRMEMPGDDGTTVTGVVSDSPADVAMIRQGDIITAIGNTPVSTSAEVIAAVQKRKAGELITVTVRRNTQTLKLKVILGSQ